MKPKILILSVAVCGLLWPTGQMSILRADNVAVPTYRSAVAVTPSDTVNLTSAPSAGLYIGVTGDVKVDMAGSGTAIVFKAVPVGILAVKVNRVYSTGTTATNILELLN